MKCLWWAQKLIPRGGRKIEAPEEEQKEQDKQHIDDNAKTEVRRISRVRDWIHEDCD